MTEQSLADLPAGRVRAWICEDALPVWLDKGVDRTGGGFEEALALDGARIPGIAKRIRVQARQIYVMSHAALLGFSDKALDAARAGYEFLTRHGWSKEGGWVHLLAPDGGVRDARRDTYDHAFILMALGWFYRASGESAALDWIERTLQFMDAQLLQEDGSLLESLPAALPRRQNPHMHFFEAMLALFEITGEQSFLARAERIYRLFGAHFFDAEAGVLREFFGEDWAPLPGPEGGIIEPGHHCEWVWLLDKYERLSGEKTGAQARILARFALKFGRDPKTQLLVDEVNLDGSMRRPSMRCWPQTEGLKAMLVLGEQGEAWAMKEAALFANGLFSRYLAVKPAGLWQDQFDPAGTGLTKTVPASTLYHVFLAFTELLRVVEHNSTAGAA